MRKFIYFLITFFLIFNCRSENYIKKLLLIKKDINISVLDNNNNPLGNIFKKGKGKFIANYNGAFQSCKLIEIKEDSEYIIFVLEKSVQTPNMDKPIKSKYKAKMKIGDINNAIVNTKSRFVNLLIYASEY